MKIMSQLKISAVCYLNTIPFVYGLQQSGLLKNFRLDLDIPSICAKKLQSEEVDISLVPVGAFTDFTQYHLISDYCIGAVGEVKTVLLLSKVPLDKIRKISLDFDSRTSVRLIKVLGEHYWHISPEWENLSSDRLMKSYIPESVVAIGDKTFTLRGHYPYIYDLAEVWINFTSLPFVFAAWISKKKMPASILAPFTEALSYGVDHKKESIEFFKDKLPQDVDCLDYLEKNISYLLDIQKRQGLELFLSYLK